MKNRIDKSKAASKEKVIPIGIKGPDGQLLEVWDCPKAGYLKLVAHCRKEKLTLDQWFNNVVEEHLTKLGYMRGGKAVTA